MQEFIVRESNLPNSMKDLVFKKLMDLVDTLKREYNSECKVMLFTNIGTVVGTLQPCSKENDMIKYVDDPSKFTLDISAVFDGMQKEYKMEESQSAYSDAYMLNIVDASIYKTGTESSLVKLDQMIVFVDQIIGFTLVKE